MRRGRCLKGKVEILEIASHFDKLKEYKLAPTF